MGADRCNCSRSCSRMFLKGMLGRSIILRRFSGMRLFLSGSTGSAYFASYAFGFCFLCISSLRLTLLFLFLFVIFCTYCKKKCNLRCTATLLFKHAHLFDSCYRYIIFVHADYSRIISIALDSNYSGIIFCSILHFIAVSFCIYRCV